MIALNQRQIPQLRNRLHDVHQRRQHVRTRRAKSLARQLLEALGETETQFGKLPLFARPLARNGFKTKSGKTLQEWKIRIEQKMIIALEANRMPSPLSRRVA